MNCPECGGKTKVSDSRPLDKIYRRRKCLECDHRFTTYEITPMMLLDFLDEHLPDDQVDRLSFEVAEEFPSDTSIKRRLEKTV